MTRAEQIEAARENRRPASITLVHDWGFHVRFDDCDYYIPARGFGRRAIRRIDIDCAFRLEAHRRTKAHMERMK